jgi:SAM-dependent methyltransferase
MLRMLPRLRPAADGKPSRAGAEAIQASSRAIAEEPSTWNPELARQAAARYAELARVWNDERGGYRATPLADALERGGPMPPGVCVEVGAGTGLLTPLLVGVWSQVLCLDLSWEMLRRSSAPRRILADASALPLASGRAGAVVLADVLLFAPEVVRVLAPDGVVLWSNALGFDAPHHVPLDVVHDALGRATPGQAWEGVYAEAGWGLWAVFRRLGS